MKILFFVTKCAPDFFSICASERAMGAEVSVILIQDAVYLAVKGIEHAQDVEQEIQNGVSIHLLARDCERRGVLQQLNPKIDLIDYNKLVDLLCRDGQTVMNY